MSLVVAITGASAGIGRATALRFAREGASVAVCARRADRLDQVAEEIVACGGHPLSVVADVSQEADVVRFVSETIARFGTLDVMVCNAGFGVYGSIDQISPSQMRKLIDVNYFGTYYAIRASLPIFRRQRRGHIVIVSSIVGKRGVPYVEAYSATKFAQVGLGECLRSELVGSGIHVSIVFPISTETEFFSVMTRESGFATRAGGPRQTPEMVADAILRGVRQRSPEIYPYRRARGLVLLNALAPGLLDKIVTRWRREPLA